MTSEDWKRYDKRMRQILDPFGSGFLTLRRLMQEWAAESGLSVHDLIEQYIAWKWRK